MNTSPSDGKDNRKKRLLLPLLGLLVGLALPIRAYAVDYAACEWCQSMCSSLMYQEYSWCAANDPSQYCYDQANARSVDCHTNGCYTACH